LAKKKKKKKKKKKSQFSGTALPYLATLGAPRSMDVLRIYVLIKTSEKSPQPLSDLTHSCFFCFFFFFLIIFFFQVWALPKSNFELFVCQDGATDLSGGALIL
jgi:hypothetical protein